MQGGTDTPTAKGSRICAAAFGDDGKHRFLNISGATNSPGFVNSASPSDCLKFFRSGSM